MLMADRLPEPGPDLSDEALFLAYKDGDEQAFARLFERYRGRLTSYAWRMVRRREEAEEIALEAFCRVLEGSWRPGGSLRAFLYTVVHRLCIDRLRQRRRIIPLFPDAHDARSESVTPEGHAMQTERLRQLERAMAKLPEAHRSILLLYYNEDLPSKEVAEILGCDDQQVRSRLSYARKLLRKLLESEEEVPR
ncbi:MAG: sigma-70 family RNA polymerase sigma factor [Deltaproteobacteria bacterium]|nr:sigma-70 family RNA polymerase sigma factor [Deltaproteobacteria bacterium]MBW2255424.1 sigma-70 family RNA polymerase sigma factor [Deltaproteobacteria bacterium]